MADSSHIDDSNQLKFALRLSIGFTLVLWLIKGAEWASGTSFYFLGVYPRTLKGLPGLITSPLIHGDIFHLIGNSVPIIILGTFLFYFYKKIALEVFLWLYFTATFWLWAFGQANWHIGASGIVYGLAFFLFVSGVIRRQKSLMSVSAIVLLLYGGMFYGMFPHSAGANVSWEGHLTGAFAGVFLALYFRKSPPLSQENEPEREETNDREYAADHTYDGDITFTYSYKSDEEDAEKTE